MKELSSRTAGFTDSVIRRMTRISNRYGAVNLSQGFPDFDPPEAVTDRLAQTAKEGPHQYALTWGAQNFREALAAKQEHFSGVRVDPEEEIVVTCGSTEAMMAAMLAVTNPGDKVIIFSPFYENYGADTILAGAEPIYVALKPPSFSFHVGELEQAFRQGAKALILCNPSNPCGKVFSYGELRIIADLAVKYDAYVITDEVYEHIVYEPCKHTYLSSLPGMSERTIICSSLSKTYSITGWRLGYVIAAPEAIDVFAAIRQIYSVNVLSQAAALACVRARDAYAPVVAQIASERERELRALRAMAAEGLPVEVWPSAANFVLARTPHATRVRERLRDEYSILVRDFSYAPGLADCLRITVGTPQENDEVLAAFATLVKEEM